MHLAAAPFQRVLTERMQFEWWPRRGLGKAFCALQQVAVRQAWHQRRQCSGRLLAPIQASMAVVTACRACPNTFLYDADAPSRMCPLFYGSL